MLKFFGINKDKRAEIPQSVRESGFQEGDGIPFDWFNQLIFEQNQDRILGSQAQVLINQATLYYDFATQTFKDKADAGVTLAIGDRITIVGLDTMTDDLIFDVNRLEIKTSADFSIPNASYNVKLTGNECHAAFFVTDNANVVDEGTNNFIKINSGVNALVPPGVILPYGAETPPTGWLECNGANVLRTTYASLFAIIGTNYGEGDASTTFTLPDLRGKFPRGWDHGVGNDPGGRTEQAAGGAIGDNVGSIQDDALQGHHHDIREQGSGIGALSGANGNLRDLPSSTHSRVGYKATSLESDGTNGTPRISLETRPKNINVMYIIKY